MRAHLLFDRHRLTMRKYRAYGILKRRAFDATAGPGSTMLSVLRELYPEYEHDELARIVQETEQPPAPERLPTAVERASSIVCSKNNRGDLAAALFSLFNSTVFNDRLPKDTKIEWNARMRTTAGLCKCKRQSMGRHYCVIILSPVVCHTAGRIRDTLLHEMCHAAVWILDKVRENHGPYWKRWCRMANAVFPDVPLLERCHSYELLTKYCYQCSQCAAKFKRNSKSIDVGVKVCARCKSQLILLRLDKKTGQYKEVERQQQTQLTGRRR